MHPINPLKVNIVNFILYDNKFDAIMIPFFHGPFISVRRGKTETQHTDNFRPPEMP